MDKSICYPYNSVERKFIFQLEVAGNPMLQDCFWSYVGTKKKVNGGLSSKNPFFLS